MGGAAPSRSRALPHRHSGLLSALGLALADVVHEAQEPCSLPYAPETFVQLDQRLSRLEEQCVDALRAQGFPRWGSRGQVGRAGWAEGSHQPHHPPAGVPPGLPGGLGLLQLVVREGSTPSAGAGGLIREGPACPPLQVPDQH